MKKFRTIIKSFTLFILTFLMISSVVFPAGAVTFVTYDDYKYVKIDDQKLYVMEYVGKTEKYSFSVPTSPSALTTTVGVYKNFMMKNKDITSITLPNTTQEIMDSAFYGCSSLSSITLPSALKTIGEDVCANTGIKSIKFNEKLETIGAGAFSENNSLSVVSIPNSVTTIGSLAFSNCSKLKFATIPYSVRKIENGAFKNCNADFIMYGYSHSIAAIYASKNGITFVPIDDTVFYGDVNKDGYIDIKDVTYLQKCLTNYPGFTLDKDSEMRTRADVNGDEEVDIQDGTLIQKYINYSIFVFPVEEK